MTASRLTMMIIISDSMILLKYSNCLTAYIIVIHTTLHYLHQ